VNLKKSDYIKIIIKEKGFKITKVAIQMGISQASLSNKINGHRPFKEKEIETLLNILDMSYDEVFNVNSIKIIDNDKTIISVNNNRYTVSKKVANNIEKMIKKEVI
jgi:transcriptional regulator with XRE-family HTH domain